MKYEADRSLTFYVAVERQERGVASTAGSVDRTSAGTDEKILAPDWIRVS